MRIVKRLCVVAGLIGILITASASVAADGDNFAWSATALDPTPLPNTTEVIVVRLWASDDGEPLPRITVCSRWHFQATTTRLLCRVTNGDGEVRLSYNIGGTATGDTVEVRLMALRSYEWTDLGSVFFTSQ